MVISVGELRRIALFDGAELDAVAPMLADCRTLHVRAGDILLGPEHDNAHLYVILHGRLRVHLDSLHDSSVTNLEPGDCTGEFSLVDGMKLAAYVIAMEDSNVIEIGRETLWDVVDSQPAVAYNLLNMLTGRVRRSAHMMASGARDGRRFDRDARVDGLTGLHNRRWLDEMFERLIRRSRMNNQPFSMLLLDLDHFKEYNDAYGHLSGDEALRGVAEALVAQARPNDVVARFGGEEFVVLLPDTEADAARSIAERLRQAIAGTEIRDQAGGLLPPVTVSIGVAEPGDGTSAQALISAADAALYRAKQAGRNRVAS